MSVWTPSCGSIAPQKTPAKSRRVSRKTGKTSRALINTPPIWVTMQKFTRSLWGRASSIERTQRRHARAALHADDRRGVPAAERQVRTASPICVAQIAGQHRTSASQTHRPEALMAFVLFATGADVPSANVQVHQFGYIRANNRGIPLPLPKIDSSLTLARKYKIPTSRREVRSTKRTDPSPRGNNTQKP